MVNQPKKQKQKRAKGIKRIQRGNLISCFSFIFNFGTFPPVVLASKEPLCVWNVCLKMQSSLHRRQSSTWDDREQLGPGQWAQFGHYQPCLQRQGQSEWHESKLPLWITLQCHLTWLRLPDQFRGFNGIIIHNWWISSATFDYPSVIKMTHLYRGAISNHDMAGWSLEP